MKESSRQHQDCTGGKVAAETEHKEGHPTRLYCCGGREDFPHSIVLCHCSKGILEQTYRKNLGFCFTAPQERVEERDIRKTSRMARIQPEICSESPAADTASSLILTGGKQPQALLE